MKTQLAIGTALMAALMIPSANAQVVVTPRARAAQVVRSERPWLGIGVKDVTDAETAKKLNLKETRGVEITNVDENSPASKAGIKEGDVVLEYNGQPVEGGEQLSRLVRETPIGRTVKLGVWRGGAMQSLSATIEASKGPQVFIANGNGPIALPPDINMPDIRAFKMPEFENMPGFVTTAQSPRIGVITEPLANQEQFAEFLGVKDGALVKQVTRNSPAEKAGIKAGDVIVKVDDQAVQASGDITRALRAARDKKTVTVVVVRNKKEMPITVTVEAVGPMGTPVRARALVEYGVRV
jgi:serine protease Do